MGYILINGIPSSSSSLYIWNQGSIITWYISLPGSNRVQIWKIWDILGSQASYYIIIYELPGTSKFWTPCNPYILLNGIYTLPETNSQFAPEVLDGNGKTIRLPFWGRKRPIFQVQNCLFQGGFVKRHSSPGPNLGDRSSLPSSRDIHGWTQRVQAAKSHGSACSEC